MLNPLSLIPTPYLLIGVAVAAAVAMGGAYVKGRDDGAAKVQNAWNAASAKQILERDKIETMNRQAATSAAKEHESDKATIQTKFRTITERVNHETEKLVYRNICLPDSGLLQLNAAVNTANGGPDPAQPSDPMPTTPAAK